MKKHIFLTFLCSFCFFCFFFYSHALALEVQYPQIGTVPGLSAKTELPGYFKYIFDLGMGLGVLIVIATLAIGGVMWALSSVYPKWKAWASDRISGAITGLFLLLFTYLIITTINPELSVFRFNFTATPTPTPPAPTQPLTPGVFLYPTTDCTNETASQGSTSVSYTASTNNLGSFLVKSGRIVQDGVNNIYYVAFLHDLPNFQGGCEQISPNDPCTITNTRTDNLASSMSVYRYNMNDNGNGITIYRKPFFKQAGGWIKISNGQIAAMKGKAFVLETLTFNGNGGDCTVPEEEQDCTKWDIGGECAKRECPKLTSENINSIDVGGKYIILFYYNKGPAQGNNAFSWSNCQIFPTLEDVNFTGPKEMKWDYIRKYGNIPNAMSISPILR